MVACELGLPPPLCTFTVSGDAMVRDENWFSVLYLNILHRPITYSFYGRGGAATWSDDLDCSSYLHKETIKFLNRLA